MQWALPVSHKSTEKHHQQAPSFCLLQDSHLDPEMLGRGRPLSILHRFQLLEHPHIANHFFTVFAHHSTGGNKFQNALSFLRPFFRPDSDHTYYSRGDNVQMQHRHCRYQPWIQSVSQLFSPFKMLLARSGAKLPGFPVQRQPKMGNRLHWIPLLQWTLRSAKTTVTTTVGMALAASELPVTYFHLRPKLLISKMTARMIFVLSVLKNYLDFLDKLVFLSITIPSPASLQPHRWNVASCESSVLSLHSSSQNCNYGFVWCNPDYIPLPLSSASNIPLLLLYKTFYLPRP